MDGSTMWHSGFQRDYIQSQFAEWQYNFGFDLNSIVDNPLLVDAPNNNFNLQSGSPAKNAGDNSVWQGISNIMDYDGVPITDASGNIVAPGGIVSCGALEYSEGTTGFNDIDDDIYGGDNVRILIYPNPAKDYLIIKNGSLKQFQLSIKSIYGETIISNKIISPGENRLCIDNLSNGIYFVVIFNDLDRTDTTIKIIKMND
jgi:hypothetical protein